MCCVNVLGQPRGRTDIHKPPKKPDNDVVVDSVIRRQIFDRNKDGTNPAVRIGDRLPPPATQCQTFPNTHAALLGSAISVCQPHRECC